MITTHLSLFFEFGAGQRSFRHHSGRNTIGTGIVASTTQTQLAATQLLNDINVVATVANADDAVKLPPVSGGEKLAVSNAGANRMQVFPYFGQDLGQGTDTAITIEPGVTEDFDGLSQGVSTQFGEGYIKSSLAFSIANGIPIWSDASARLLTSTLVYITSTGLGVFFENPAAPLHAHFDHSTFNTVREVSRITRTTSGTAAAGIGARHSYEVETATGPQNLEIVATTDGVCTNVTPGSEEGALLFNVMQAGAAATEVGRADTTGMDLVASKSYSIGGVAILADSAGTTTLSNIDAIDSTTLTTLQDALEVSRTEHTTQTTDATPTVVGSAAITEDTSVTFTVRGHGRENATGDTLSMRIDGCIRNEGGTTAFVGEPLRIRNGDSGSDTWELTVIADDTSDELDVQVTGEGSHTIDWRVTIDTIVE